MRGLLLLSSLILAAQPVARPEAAELAPLTSVELHELCLAYVDAPESDDGQACAAYVRGFMEGSERVILWSEKPAEAQEETFSERAWRTRLGTRRPPQPRYCVAESLSLEDFVSQLLTQAAQTPPAQDVSAQALLYGTLSRFHRCSR